MTPGNRIFSSAQMSPSNCNVQPWQIYVVSGAKKDVLKDKLVGAMMSWNPPNPDFTWDSDLLLKPLGDV